MSKQSAEKDVPRPDATDVPCPACGAPVNVACAIRLSGVDTTGWSHDARIMAPIYTDLRARVMPPKEKS